MSPIVRVDPKRGDFRHRRRFLPNWYHPEPQLPWLWNRENGCGRESVRDHVL